ncbi:MAG: AAA family ATPase [Methanosarcinaceae archaeon]|nr:AAA family ATPase [Methanosarcinaceae archaeon]
MRFKHLYIENFRSYKASSIDFCDGVTVISGPNGSGKSSILEACFVGLFGAAALSGTGLQIADIVFKGESKATIILEFDHLGKEYKIEQQFRVSRSGSGTNSVSVLYENGEIVAEQTKKTYAYICDILNMDEQAYKNCAYIRQGEIDDLINAKPKERQKMIDDLLRLGKLEEYRERAAFCKTAVSRQIRIGEEIRNDIVYKIDSLSDKNIHQKLNECRETIEKIDQIILKYNKLKEGFAAQKIQNNERIKTYREKLNELTKTRNSIEELVKSRNEENSNAMKNMELLLNSENIYNELKIKQRDGIEELLQTLKTKENEKFIEWVESENKGDELKEIQNLNDSRPGPEPETLLKAAQTKEKLYRDWKQSATDKKRDAVNKHDSVFKEIRKMNEETKKYIESLEETKNGIVTIDNDIIGLQKKLEQNIEFVQNKRNAYKETLQTLIPDASFSFLYESKLPEQTDVSGWSKWYTSFEETDKYVNVSLQSDQKEINELEVKHAALKSELDEKTKGIQEIERTIKSYKEKVEKASLEKQVQNNAMEKIKLKIADEEIKTNMKKESLKKITKEFGFEVNDSNSADLLFTETYNKYTENEKEIATLLSKKERILKANEKYKELTDAGKCPTCGQTVDKTHLKNCFDEEKQEEEELEKLIESANSEKMKLLLSIENIKKVRKIYDEITEMKSKMINIETERDGIKKIIDKLSNDIEENTELINKLNLTKTSNEVLIKTVVDSLNKKDKEILGLKDNYSKRFKLSNEITNIKKLIITTVSEILQLIPHKESLLNLKTEKEDRVNDFLEKIKNEKELIKEMESERNKLEEEIKHFTEYEEKISACYEMKKSVTRNAEEIHGNAQKLKLLETEIKGFEKSKELFSNSIEEKDREIKEKREKEKELLNTVEDENKLNEYIQFDKKLTENIDKIDVEIKNFNEKRSEHQKNEGLLQGELKQLHEYKNELNIINNKNEYIKYVLEDVEALETMYLRIRSEMRGKNIEALDQLLNEMFTFIYSNNAYSHIELDGDYNLKVYEKNGIYLEPKLLSGGERALFNLSLRCAIYRLLSHGFGEHTGSSGTSGSSVLPPMVLDEPTVFLDSGHIRQLIKLIDLMKNQGVGQIIVVSHDESLIDSADRVYSVYKDTLTNTSSFTEFGEKRCIGI